MNYLILFWLTFSFVISIIGIFTLNFNNCPYILKDLYCYGKARRPLKNAFFNIPKRFFYTFYLIALFWFIFIFVVLTNMYVYGHKAPHLLLILTKILTGGSFYLSGTSSSPVGIYLACLLLVIHALRRLYECLRISVYSSKAKINGFHLTLGYAYYTLVGFTLLSMAPGFTFESYSKKSLISLKDIRMHHVFSIILYIWATYHHHSCHKILANLRKDKNGKVVNDQHKIPYGDFFEYVSNPHYFSEILIYISLWIILDFGESWTFVVVFVVCNQLCAGLMNHRWLRNNFGSSYPTNRKAVIPFLL